MAILPLFTSNIILNNKGIPAMGIIHTITNNYLEDPQISWKAKGIMEALYPLPEHQRIITTLVKASKDGESSVRSGIDELIKYGYISIVKGAAHE